MVRITKLNSAEIEFLAKDKVSNVISNIEKSLKELEKSSKKTSKKTSSDFDNLFSSVKKFAGVLGLTAIAGTALFAVKNFTTESVRLGFEIEGLENAFNRMAGQSAPSLISSLKAASAGTVASIDAIQAANRAMLLGIDKDALPQMMEIARAAAQAMGTDVTSAFNDIATGIGRQSKMILDNLGIMISVEEANKRYAEKLGTVSTELTDTERKQAFLNEALRIGQNNIDAMGGAINTQKEELQRLATRWKDFKIEFGKDMADSIDYTVEWANIFLDIDTYLNNINTNMKNISGEKEENNNSLSNLVNTFEKLTGYKIPAELKNLKQIFRTFRDELNKIDDVFRKQLELQEKLKKYSSNLIYGYGVENNILLQLNKNKQTSSEIDTLTIDESVRLTGVTNEYKTELEDLKEQFKTGVISGAKFLLLEKELNEKYKADIDIIQDIISLENERTNGLKNQTDATNDLIASQSALVTLFGSAKSFEKERAMITSGDVGATEAVKALFGVGATNTENIINNTEDLIQDTMPKLISKNEELNTKIKEVTQSVSILGDKFTINKQILQDSVSYFQNLITLINRLGDTDISIDIDVDFPKNELMETVS